jgi:hypothetical protein
MHNCPPSEVEASTKKKYIIILHDGARHMSDHEVAPPLHPWFLVEPLFPTLPLNINWGPSLGRKTLSRLVSKLFQVPSLAFCQLCLQAMKNSVAPVKNSRLHALYRILKIDLEGHVGRCTPHHIHNGKKKFNPLKIKRTRRLPFW